MRDKHRLEDLLQIAKLPRSTFYYHVQHLGQEKHSLLKKRIRELFEQNKARLGYRRIWLALRSDQNPEYAQFRSVNKKLVYKLMRQMGLKSKVRSRGKYVSYRGTVSHIAENKLNRQFSPVAPNKVWVSDVTEFRVAGSKVYLSPLMDLFDRSILSYRLSTSPNTAFTAGSLHDAISRYAPAAGLMVHTDQGFQYQHLSWRRLIDEVIEVFPLRMCLIQEPCGHSSVPHRHDVT